MRGVVRVSATRGEHTAAIVPADHGWGDVRGAGRGEREGRVDGFGGDDARGAATDARVVLESVFESDE